jgi:DEAD/DEAH box helicase domain-containing protein
MKDKLVFDIETKNSFADVGGKDQLEKLEVSLTVVYSYNNDTFTCYRDDAASLAALGKVLQNAGLIIGFSSEHFDIPVLNKYFPFNLGSVPSLDLLKVIEEEYGRRIGLDLLAKTNLGIGKTNHGLEAIEFYRNGDWESLERYCTQDVRVTRDLYDLAKKQGYLMVPDKWTQELHKVTMRFDDGIEESNTLF